MAKQQQQTAAQAWKIAETAERAADKARATVHRAEKIAARAWEKAIHLKRMENIKIGDKYRWQGRDVMVVASIGHHMLEVLCLGDGQSRKPIRVSRKRLAVEALGKES